MEAYQISRAYTFIGYSIKVPEERDVRRDEGDRIAFFTFPPPAGIHGVPCESLVDTDEFGICMYDTQKRLAVSPIGQTPILNMDTMPGSKLSVILSVTSEAVISYMITDLAGTSKETFFTYVDAFLLPTLAASGYDDWVCLMDNLRAHKFEATQQLFRDADVELVFRPKYSPDMGFVETVIHLVKAYLRRHRAEITYDNLPYFVQQALQSVRGFRNLLRLTGY
ncbi:hypothetical protein GPECTOR_659g783 [Gonium pectorale]|uniref:Tc1-like transposase DDE domain-containing protein n=1 Tax=Gonium pectorale TaxID=33097 RepID=A0A150FUC0_GONPE|nr:hypothetical protein GPECTOR_659g783 [Gonium pectorale]|eukprot:KXZ41197.1 hypothetical protein GPECTOR_659g783 [Gonium pectorale]